METPKTLQEAIVYFAAFENCRQFVIDLRWSDGKVRCPYCQSEKVSYLATAKLYKCYGDHPKPKFSLKVGTIMEDSALSIDKWLTAMWMIVNCRNGISSCEIARDLGITQKSAWHMAHRIRFALHHGTIEKLSGEVEADETFIGGKARNMHKSKKAGKGYQHRGIINKTIVMGMLERGGKVMTKVIQEREKETLHGHVRACIEEGVLVQREMDKRRSPLV
jgi:transposase-like protein